MIRKTNLPESITLSDGAVLKPVIGGHLEQKPFLTIAGSGVDVTKNGWGNDLPSLDNERRLIISEAKRRGLRHRMVSVLSRNLRGKLDLHGSPYRGSMWVFVEVRKEETK
jgi:hypothetical protein